MSMSSGGDVGAELPALLGVGADPADRVDEVRAVVAHVDAGDAGCRARRGRAASRRARGRRRCRPSRTRRRSVTGWSGDGDAREVVGELAHRADVAPAAERVRAALGHDVRAAAGARASARPASASSRLRSRHAGRDDPAAARRRRGGRAGCCRSAPGGCAGSSVRRISTLLHAELRRGERGRARVVRLLAAAGDDVRGLLLRAPRPSGTRACGPCCPSARCRCGRRA